MTEHKQPAAGEWWIRNDGKPMVYIIGIDSNGMVCYEHSQSDTLHRTTLDNWKTWHHEPACTGFDWQPPAPIDPGEGWELLPVGTVLQDGDEYLDFFGVWTETQQAGDCICDNKTMKTYRRRKPPAETWPKYYLRTSGADSWVYRADGRYSIRNLTCDCVADPAEWYWRHGNMIEITESEALARVKPAEPIDPGEGWELLPVGTVLQDGDEYLDFFGVWTETQQAGDCICDNKTMKTYRRRKPPAETWPKYYESHYHENAYVKRLSEEKYIVVKTDGSKSGEFGWVSHMCDNRKAITESEALARVKPAEPIAHPVKSKITLAEARELASKSMAEIEAARCPAEPIVAERIPDNRPSRDVLMDVLEWLDPEDETAPTNVAAAVETIEQWLEDNPEPAESIAHPVEHTATPLVTAVGESPDDWVEITDTHPGHIRRACDEVCRKDDNPPNWIPVRSSIGMPQSEWSFTRIRCRRRDLPAPPAQLPALIPGVATDRMVDLFLSWRLPSDFQPDGGISFTSRPIHESWPTGTNLFTASQARKMIEHLLSVPEETATPPAPQPKRTPVRLWWYDGNIVGRYDHSPPTDPSFHEIKFDADGFYVEGE